MANIKVRNLPHSPSVRQAGHIGRAESTAQSNSLDPSAKGDFSALARARGANSKRILEEFSLPSQDVRDALASPTLSTSLIEIIEQLAPDGVAEDAQAQYTASVLVTHLSARRQLATKLNALIRA